MQFQSYLVRVNVSRPRDKAAGHAVRNNMYTDSVPDRCPASLIGSLLSTTKTLHSVDRHPFCLLVYRTRKQMLFATDIQTGKL